MTVHAIAMQDWIAVNPPDEKGLLTRGQVRDAIFRAAQMVRFGSWQELEDALSAVPAFCDPMGPLGPLWIAVQMELNRPPVRAGIEHTMVAQDVLEGFRRYRETGEWKP